MSEKYSPFTSETDLKVESVSEVALIEKIRLWLGDTCPEGVQGIGDDCAVHLLEGQERYGLTTIDGVGYGMHFDDSVPAFGVGRKLLGRNISDIASMGGYPTRAVLSLWLAPDVSLVWLEAFYQGLASMGREYRVSIVGGDVARASKGCMIADLCLQGEAKRPLLRKQAPPGARIWVSGQLGGSILRKHYEFSPRVEEGLWLSEESGVCSMIDISDGLAKDLKALVGDRRVLVKDLPISEAAVQLSQTTGKHPLYHACNDGEDYELLFATLECVNPEIFAENWSRRFNTPLTCIGEVLDREGYEVQDADGRGIDLGKGYEHF